MESAARIDAVLREAVECGDVAGVVACAAGPDATIYSGAVGKRRLDEPAPMASDTMFWIASLTKAITTVAALQLVERGRIGLDDPAGAFVHELAAPHVLVGFDSAGAPLTRPATRPITLRTLLTHTAGFGYEMWSADVLRYQRYAAGPDAVLERDDTLLGPLLFDPGERFNYGVNIDWAGTLIERASGIDLQTYVRDNICGPLGMADTSFSLDAGQRARLAGMHARKPDGTLRTARFDIPERTAKFIGGGGMFGTAGDYVRFLQMLLRGGERDGARVLRSETVAMMLQNQIGDLAIDIMRSSMPAATNDVNFFANGEKWGFGFLLHPTAVAGGRSAGSASWAGLANTYYWLDRAAGVCGAIMTQQRPFADPAVLRLYSRFEHGVYGALVERGRV